MPLRAYSPQEVVLTERRRLEIPLLAMIWVSASASSMASGQWFDLAAATLAVGVNLLAVLHSREIYVRRFLVNAAVIAATLALCLELAGNLGRLLPSLQHYLVLIQLCKLFERKGNRDYVQMLAMSLLMMVASCLGAHPIWLAVAMAAHLVLACYVTMVFTLKRGLDAAAAARLSSEASPLAPRRVAWNVIRDWPSGVILRRVAAMTAAMLLVGTVIFLTAPRGAVLGGMGASLGDEDSIFSGFSKTVHLGDARQVYLSDRVAMEVRLRPFRDGGRMPQGPLYLRGVVYDTYGQSAPSAWGRPSSGATAVHWPALPDEVLDEAFLQEITMADSLLPTLFGQWPMVHSRPEGWPRIADGLLNLEWNPNPPISGPVRYEVASLRPEAAGRHLDTLAALRARLGEQMPDPPPAVFVAPGVKEQADQWCQDLLAERAALGGADNRRLDALNLAIAQRLAQRLREGYAYTLDLSGSDPSRDGVEDFLFHTRRGHCEYFASALAVLCRSLGVRARLATGFAVEGPFEEGRPLVVRERNAHAWTEVFTPSTDWAVLDATPSGGLAPVRSASWWARLRDRLNDLQFSWYDKVVGYDASMRQKLGQWFQSAFGGLVDGLRAAGESIKDSVFNLLLHGQVDRAVLVLMGLTGAGAIAAEGFLLRGALEHRARRRQATQAERDLRQLDFVLKLFVRMERRGLVSRAGQTLRESAREAQRLFALNAAALEAVVDLYYAVRWGRQPLPREALCRARADAQGLSEAVKLAKPAARE